MGDFEQWHRKEFGLEQENYNYRYRKNSNGDYADDMTYLTHIGWQAAIASMQGECKSCDGRGEVGGPVVYGHGEGAFETHTCLDCNGAGITYPPSAAAKIAEQDAEIARLQKENEQLKMAIEYDNADDDAEWEPPHPIFQLAQERDNFMHRVNELQKELEEAKEKEREFMWERLEHMRISIHLLGRHYQKEDLSELRTYLEENVARIDAALSKIGGGE